MTSLIRPLKLQSFHPAVLSSGSLAVTLRAVRVLHAIPATIHGPATITVGGSIVGPLIDLVAGLEKEELVAVTYVTITITITTTWPITSITHVLPQLLLQL